MSNPLKLLLLAIATLLIGALAVSNQSFWIDEGAAALKALQPSLAGWWQSLRVEGHSNLQLLPHLFYLWLWEKIFGGSEISLRAANVPLLFAGLAAAIWGLQSRPRLQFWFAAIVLVNAFTWYYTGEARPYLLLFAGACLTLACLARAFDDPEGCANERRWFVLLCAGLVAVAATSLIAVPWAGAWALSAVVLLGLPRSLLLLKRHFIIAGLCTATLCGVGAYYLWTLTLGARASTAVGGTGLLNVGLVFYEQLGFAGLGPGRNDLRFGGLRAFAEYALPLGIAATALLATAAYCARPLLRELTENKRLAWLLFAATVFPFATVIGAGWATHVRILGRHLMPFFPFVLLAMAVAAERLVSSRRPARLFVAVLLLATLVLSAVQIRFAPRHARDDYRGAAAVARAELKEDRIVWWAADESTARYYGVPIADGENRGGAIYLMNPSRPALATLQPADTIVLSKRDVYDASGALSAFVAVNQLIRTHQFQSFEVFARP